MHTFLANENTRFNYNSDLSGNVTITRLHHLEVPGVDLLEFVAEWIRSEHISAMEKADWMTLLSLPPHSGEKK